MTIQTLMAAISNGKKLADIKALVDSLLAAGQLSALQKTETLIGCN